MPVLFQKKPWFPFEAEKRDRFFSLILIQLSGLVIFWDSEREQKPL